MDRGATEYSQLGLHTPYPLALSEAKSEEATADHASAVHYTPHHDARANGYSNSATPTSEYGVYPASARSGSFPEHIHRQYHPASNHSGSSGGMAQSTSPSMPLQDGGRINHQPSQNKSDQDVPIDPSIAASSPTYPPHGGQYSPYPQQQDMQHGYPSHPQGGPMYAQPRPDWAGYAGGQPHHPMQGGYPVTGASTPTSAAPAGSRPGQVSLDLPSHQLPSEEQLAARAAASNSMRHLPNPIRREDLGLVYDRPPLHPHHVRSLTIIYVLLWLRTANILISHRFARWGWVLSVRVDIIRTCHFMRILESC